MKIRTQLIISIILSGLALLIITASVIVTNQQIDRLNQQENLANSIILGATELSYLSNDYLVFHESQQLDRWNTRYASFSNDLAKLSVNKPEQQVLVNNIRSNQQRLKEVFGDVVSTIESQRQADPGQYSVNQTYIQLSWSRIAVQNRGIIFDASRLAEMLRDEENQARQANTLLISGLLGAFIIFLLVDYLLIFGRTIKSIANLRAGTRVIGSGNLDYSIKARKGDEIGELANAFNQMTARLKTITASKSDLEREIAERRQAEEALKQAKDQAELYVDIMGHDINNLNQVAMGNLELLKDDSNLSEEQKEMITAALESMMGSAGIIDNVRKIQAINEEKVSLYAEDINDLILDCIKGAPKPEGKKVTINYAPGNGLMINGTALMKEAFCNLIYNSIKHSGREVVIDVSVDIVDRSGKKFYDVSIADNGPGIPDDIKSRLFNRFQRGKTKAHGKGLGLFIARSLVENIGGDVRVEDRVPGDYSKGAKFVVSLPACEGCK
jgi:signal transduction histidine kinase